MPSLLETAACIGVTGNFSVLRDFYGFFRGALPPDPTNAEVSVSLARELNEIAGEHFNVNFIAVGDDQFDDNDNIEVDYSIYRLRNIYAANGIGVGRIEHYGISTAEADRLDSPTKKSQLEDLTQQWTVPNNGVDLFIIANLNVPSGSGILLGRSAINGPCGDKEAKGMNGSVSGLWGSEQTSRTVAHELGHYFSLKHKNDQPTNLMCQSGSASNIRTSVNITSSQEDDVRDHCFVVDWC